MTKFKILAFMAVLSIFILSGFNCRRCFCQSDEYDCSDFKDQKKAQKIFDCCLDKVGMDIHKLDKDNNNRACDN